MLHGVSGLHVTQLCRIISQKVHDLSPDAAFLEIGTNDLGSISPEIVGSDIHDIVEYLHFSLGIKMVGVCLVIPRRVHESGLPDAGFNLLALKLTSTFLCCWMILLSLLSSSTRSWSRWIAPV